MHQKPIINFKQPTMKKLLLTCLAAGTLISATAQTVAPAIPRDEKIEQNVEALLQKMTLEEKIGQMCELTIDLLQKRVNPFEGMDPKNPDVKALKKVLKKYIYKLIAKISKNTAKNYVKKDKQKSNYRSLMKDYSGQ